VCCQLFAGDKGCKCVSSTTLSLTKGNPTSYKKTIPYQKYEANYLKKLTDRMIIQKSLI
jgi:hypothetical protein